MDDIATAVVLHAEIKTLGELEDHLSEAIHTAFRKATDCAEAMPIHRLIESMDPDEWARVVEFVAAGIAQES